MAVMQKRIYRALVLPLATATLLAGCGIFGEDDDPDFRNPFFPDREATRITANISSRTRYADPDDGKKAVFTATMYDKDGLQFYGPKVELNGTEITPVGTSASANYQLNDMDYATGQTWTLAVQGHSATTAPAIPPVLITQPTSTKSDSGSYPSVTQAAGAPVEVAWTGGDPAEPVYVVVYGNPDGKGDRRFFVKDNPAQRPTDPENYGLPIPNTGTLTIPATVEERVVDSKGNTTTRTVTLFDNPSTSTVRAFYVYVVQRKTTAAPPIQFSVNSVAYVILNVPAKPK